MSPEAPLTSKSEQARRARRRHRLADREALRLLTSVKSVRGCGLPMSAEWVGVTQNVTGRCGYGGIATCSRAWACPVCAAKIGARRATEITDVLSAHAKDNGHGSPGGAALLTLTVRHDASQPLAVVWSGVQSAWYAVTSTASWTRERDRWGIRGYIRATEVTHGQHGWHVHCHTILLTRNKMLGEDALAALGARLYSRWSRGAQRAGLKAPSPRHGIDLRVMDTDDAAVLAEYLAKLGDRADAELRQAADAAARAAASGLASEAALGALKQAKNGNRTPMQILGQIVGTLESIVGCSLGQYAHRKENQGKPFRELADGLIEKAPPEIRKILRRDLRLWHEWEVGSQGRRALIWSQGLRDAMGVTEKSDEEIAAEDEAGEVIASLKSGDYRWLSKNAPLALGAVLDGAEESGRTGIDLALKKYKMASHDPRLFEAQRSRGKTAIAENKVLRQEIDVLRMKNRLGLTR